MLANMEAQGKLQATNPKALSKDASKQIKAAKDNHGKRRGTDNN